MQKGISHRMGCDGEDVCSLKEGNTYGQSAVRSHAQDQGPIHTSAILLQLGKVDKSLSLVLGKRQA